MASKNLVIVESPAKAKTITKFLGEGYEVKSTFGHIRDLPKKGLGIDKSHGFKPTYEVEADKIKIVNELKKASRGSQVWLASDGDREGEAIAWHVCEALQLKPSDIKRIVFHEITKPAITEAINHPRTVDMDLVDAQQARRILDRLVGYELSPMLWKKIQAGLSAGRVQSVAVRLVVEREREIRGFKREGSFKITALLRSDGKEFPAELNKKIASLDKSKIFLGDVSRAEFTVKEVNQKPASRNPGAPFITSTLQQQAARNLGFGVKQTMVLAQRLYEEGQITYMRTDSTNLSSIAVDEAKKYIIKNFGEKYSRPKQYQTTSRSAQEAHEAIRPTHINRSEAGTDTQQKKLYNLIWRRTLASQMAAATLQNTEATIAISTREEYLIARGEILNFDGFMRVWGGIKDDIILPGLKPAQKLNLVEMTAQQTFSKPAARYSEASLVKKLEELGIGRPSTYAPTISTIQARGYIEKKDIEGQAMDTKELVLVEKKISERQSSLVVGADRNKLLPTPLAEMTTDFLVKNFSEIVDYDFTARAENELDQIAAGNISWQKMIEEFYRDFEPMLKKSANVSRSETVPSRKLGVDPETKKPVFARYGKFGPFLQIGEAAAKDKKEEIKPVFASMPEGSNLDGVTLEQALQMFTLPRTVGKTVDGQTILANIGRFGPYIKVGKDFTSIKGHDTLRINEAEARKVLEEQSIKKAKKLIKDYGKIKILMGPYGPYVTDGSRNARIPKNLEPASLSLEESYKLLSKKEDKKSRKRSAKVRT